MNWQVEISGVLVRLWWRRARWPLLLLGVPCVALFILDPVPQDEAAKIVFAAGIMGACVGLFSPPSIELTGNREFLLTRAVSRTRILIIQIGCGLVSVLVVVALILAAYCCGLRAWAQGAVLANEFFPYVEPFERRALPFVLQFALLGYCMGCALTPFIYLRTRLQKGAMAMGSCVGCSFFTLLTGMYLYSWRVDASNPGTALAFSAILSVWLAYSWVGFRWTEVASLLPQSGVGSGKKPSQGVVHPSPPIRATLSVVRCTVAPVLLIALFIGVYWHTPVSMASAFNAGRYPSTMQYLGDRSCPIRILVWLGVLALGIGCGLRGMRDSRRRGHGWCVRVGSFLLCSTLIGWFYYVELRRRGHLAKCPGCGRKALVWLQVCPYCGGDSGAWLPVMQASVSKRRVLLALVGVVCVVMAALCIMPADTEPMARALAPWQAKFVALDAGHRHDIDIFVNGLRMGRSPVAVRVEELLRRVPRWERAPALPSSEAPPEKGRYYIPILCFENGEGEAEKWAPFRRVVGRRRLFVHFKYLGFMGESPCEKREVEYGVIASRATFEFAVSFGSLVRRVDMLVANLSLSEAPATERWLETAAGLGDLGLAHLSRIRHGMGTAPPQLSDALDLLLRRRFGITGDEIPGEAEVAAHRILDAARSHEWDYYWQGAACRQALNLLGSEAAPVLYARLRDLPAYPLPHRGFFEQMLSELDGVAIPLAIAEAAPERALPVLVWAARPTLLSFRHWRLYEAIGGLKTDGAARFLGKRLLTEGGRGALRPLVATGRSAAIPYIREMQRPLDVSAAELLAALVELGDERALAEAEATSAKRAPAPSLARELAMAFGRRGDARAVKALTRLLRQTEHRGIRESALRSLARCKPREALKPLAYALNEGPRRETKAVVAALVERNLADAWNLLLLVARGEDETLKETLARCAASRPGRVPFTVLDALAKVENAESRGLVVEGLAPTRQGMKLLETMTDDPDPAVRERAREQLVLLREAAELL